MAEAGRVVAGSAKGLRLSAPGPGTRPFSDRMKQILFAILEPDLAGSVVLDLFAGSGGGAIEALSRGAERAVLVEHDGSAARVVGENLKKTGFGSGQAHVVRRDALAYLRDDADGDGPFDIVILDPPYARTDLLTAALEILGNPAAGLLTPAAIVVAAYHWRQPPPEVSGLLASERERRIGESTLRFYEVRLDAGSPPEREHAEPDQEDR